MVSDSVGHSESELRSRLTDEQFAVTQNAATEAPFSGVYHDEKSSGLYRCIVCEAALFNSDTKYDSGSGWPSFWQPVSAESVTEHEDMSLGTRRVEVACSTCGAHLGHVFPDGPAPTGARYCINSAALNLDKE